MVRIDALSNDAFELLIEPVWSYLAVSEPPAKSDAIFLFGGIDLNVPRHAALLFFDRYAEVVLVSGNAGRLTDEVFEGPEARMFTTFMERLGVPRNKIVLEDRATNTAENVSFGIKALKRRIGLPQSVIAVAKPFLMRRCVATFRLQFPDVRVIPNPPPGPPLLFVDRPRHRFAHRLVSELRRLRDYHSRGFITEQSIPPSVDAAAREITRLLDGLTLE